MQPRNQFDRFCLTLLLQHRDHVVNNKTSTKIINELTVPIAMLAVAPKT